MPGFETRILASLYDEILPSRLETDSAKSVSGGRLVGRVTDAVLAAWFLFDALVDLLDTLLAISAAGFASE
jgi:hypothetical protein